jgi:hypothetical protein
MPCNLVAPVLGSDQLALTRCLIGVAALACACTVATRAIAQTEAETVDAGRGLIQGSTRRIGLGGAFVALADDSEGVAINPASVALRLPHSFSAWDYGFGIDLAVGAWLPENDIYNQPTSNETDQSTALFGSVAGNVYYRHAGLGVSAEAQRNAGSREDQAQGVTSDLAANFGLVHANLGYGFLDGQLLLGAGPRMVGMSFDRDSDSGLFSKAGVGYSAGVVIKPIVAQYRFAAAYKSAITAELPGEGSAPGSFHVPWEVAVGFAYQIGRRPLNPPLVTAEQLARQSGNPDPTPSELKEAEDELFERYLRLQRRYLLVSTELSLIEGGGHLGFSGQSADSRPIISPRVGLESEVIAHHLRLRGGSYYEPALVDGARPRVHGTGGFDVRLFRWDVFGLIDRFDYWQLSLAADAARAYLNTSFSIGFWH